MQGVHQLVYVSTYNSGRVDSPLKSLRDIVAVSRRNNARAGITGYLIFDGDGFLQILEGDKIAVDALYARIESDPRHRDTRIIGSLQALRRSFQQWAMAGYLRSPQDAAIFAGHGLIGSITQTKLSAPQVLALAIDLAAAKPETVDA